MRERTRIRRKPNHPLAQDDLLQHNSDLSAQTTEAAPSIIHQVLDTPGQTLDDETRSFMEPRFGHDFSQVRVHTDERAVESAQAVDALAYTVGSDIVFNKGRYAPDSQSGKHLLAHELTHVVQQDGTGKGEQMVVGPADNHLEKEADTVSAQVIASPESKEEAPTTHRTEAVISRTPTNRLVQRQNEASTKERLDDLEKRQRVLVKQQAATALDQRWRARFGERLASYKQAILRISGGLEAATQGFQSAQVAQAQTDALATQLWGMALAITFAVGFEWAFSALLTNLGTQAEKIEKTIELVENPANAAVSGGVNVAGVVTGMNSLQKGQAPDVKPAQNGGGGSAMAFLTRNLEALEHHSQLMEQAFITRGERMQGFTDEQWVKFDPGAQESIYQGLLNDLNNSGNGIESLKPAEEVGLIIERYMWALWLQGLQTAEIKKIRDANEQGMATGSGPLYPDERKAEEQAEAHPEFDIGTDIETRFNDKKLDIAGRAGVTLSGHWFWPNSPGDWKLRLLTWARSYKDTLKL